MADLGLIKFAKKCIQIYKKTSRPKPTQPGPNNELPIDDYSEFTGRTKDYDGTPSVPDDDDESGGNDGVTDDDEDAALVDSFFLPGGILDPDFDNLKQQEDDGIPTGGRLGLVGSAFRSETQESTTTATAAEGTNSPRM